MMSLYYAPTPYDPRYQYQCRYGCPQPEESSKTCYPPQSLRQDGRLLPSRQLACSERGAALAPAHRYGHGRGHGCHSRPVIV